jgi:hypothetical protein
MDFFSSLGLTQPTIQEFLGELEDTFGKGDSAGLIAETARELGLNPNDENHFKQVLEVLSKRTDGAGAVAQSFLLRISVLERFKSPKAE